jgi:hypothetical protein
MYRHILIPTDGSELSEKAVAHGVALAKANNARLAALHVSASFHVSALDPITAVQNAQERHQQRMRVWHQNTSRSLPMRRMQRASIGTPRMSCTSTPTRQSLIRPHQGDAISSR